MSNNKNIAEPKSEVQSDNSILAGWPNESKIPFVEPAYYEMFPEALQPKFLAGGQTSVNMSFDAVKHAEYLWEKPFELITVVNVSVQSWNVHIPGPAPGAMVGIKVPPFGVLRGVLHKELQGGMSGSRFPLRAVIPAIGDCHGKETIKLEDGTVATSCRYYNCPQHPMQGMAHSIRMAYHYVSSIGEALPDPKDPDHTASYIPPIEHAEKQLYEYQNFDKRAEVTVWAAKRLMYLKTREARIKVMTAQGQSIGGR